MKPHLYAFIIAMSACNIPAQETKAPASSETAKDGVKHVDAAGAKKLLDEAAAKKDGKVVVLDVRRPEEFQAGHIGGAVNVDFQNAKFAEEAAKLDKGKTYVVHCQGGGRSTKSLEVLKKLGFKSIVHLDGGFSGWEKAKLPVVK
jgi:phage shock protein E